MTGPSTSPEILRRLLHGGLWSLVIRAAGIVVSLATNALLARLLVPDEMGAYFLTMSVVTLTCTIAQLGLPQTVVRIVAVSMGSGLPGRAKRAFAHATIMCLFSAAIIAALFYVAIGKWLATQVLHSAGLYSVVGTASLMILALGAQGVLAEVHRGLHDVRSALLFGTLLGPFISSVLFAGLWIIRGHSNLQDIFALSLGCALVTLAISTAFLRPKLRSLHGAGTAGYRELLQMGWPLCVIQVSVFFATQGDLWVIGAFLTEKDVAIYGALSRLLLLMTITHSLVVTVLQSTAAELHAKGERQRLQRIIQTMALGASAPAGMLLVIYFVFGTEILNLIFGSLYGDGRVPLLILGSFHFVGMLLGPADMLLIMTGHQMRLMWWTAIVVAVEFLLALLLVRPLGMSGVAWAWGLGAILYNGGAWIMGYKILGMKTNAAFA